MNKSAKAIFLKARKNAEIRYEKIEVLAYAYQEKKFLGTNQEIQKFLDSKNIVLNFVELKGGKLSEGGKLVKVDSLDKLYRMEDLFPKVVEALELCNNEELDNLIGTLAT